MNKIKIFFIGLLTFAVVGGSFFVDQQKAKAATLSGGNVSLSTPTAGATNVTYTIDFSGVTTSAINCINIRFTSTLGSSSLPTGMDTSSAALSGTSDYIPTPASWTVDNTASASGIVKITYASGETPASSSNRTIVLTGIGNGSTAETTYYVELSTFSNTDCSTGAVDSGNATFVFTSGLTVSATVNPSLSFDLIGTSCSLGTLSSSSASTCTHTLSASTNATGGYTLSYIAGSTLTSGSDTISAIGATAATSSPGTEQFGFNLVANTSPSVGANPSGGSGAAATNYGTANSFAFTTSGADIASTSGPSTATTYTASYLANISSSTEAGSYSTSVVYNITATY